MIHEDDDQVRIKVWWIPQIPGVPYERMAPSFSVAKEIYEVLAEYDAFQFEHKIKGDYANTGGISICHPALTSNDWYDIELNGDEDDLADWIVEAKRLGIGYDSLLT